MSAAADKLLCVRDLSVAFGQGEREVLAVDKVSFDIGAGETETDQERPDRKED